MLLCLITIFILGISGTLPAFAMQSLADAARREAERRERIERLGIEEKVIEGNEKCSPLEGNVSVFKPSDTGQKKTIPEPFSSRDRSSLRQYRAKLLKLDNDIRKGEAQLEKLRGRLDSLRRKSLGIDNFKGFSRNEESRDRTEVQIEELQTDLKLLRKERRELYDSGRKDGFLPGELEGKGIVP